MDGREHNTAVSITQKWDPSNARPYIESVEKGEIVNVF
jgi:hypothetical protein